MQILIGSALRDLRSVERFTTPLEYQKLRSRLNRGQWVYDRLYTRAVEALGITIKGTTMSAYSWMRCRRFALFAAVI